MSGREGRVKEREQERRRGKKRKRNTCQCERMKDGREESGRKRGSNHDFRNREGDVHQRE